MDFLHTDILLTLVFLLGALVIAAIPAGLMLICRPLEHQFEWEKRLQGDNGQNGDIKQQTDPGK